MTEQLFLFQLQSAISVIDSLEQVSQTMSEQAERVERIGRRIGFVVGKITPSEGETLLGNKQLLFRRTLEIAHIVDSQGTDVFSSAIIPDSLEGRFPAETFYTVFDDFVRRYAQVLYTTNKWEQSWGARNEVSIARGRSLEVVHYQNGKLVNDVHGDNS